MIEIYKCEKSGYELCCGCGKRSDQIDLYEISAWHLEVGVDNFILCYKCFSEMVEKINDLLVDEVMDGD